MEDYTNILNKEIETISKEKESLRPDILKSEESLLEYILECLKEGEYVAWKNHNYCIKDVSFCYNTGRVYYKDTHFDVEANNAFRFIWDIKDKQIELRNLDFEVSCLNKELINKEI